MVSGLLRILSLSGGGIRGILQTVLLEQLESDIGAPLRQHFDLICGTSTGGIVALAIANGIPLREMTGLYRHEGPLIFKDRAGKFVRRGGRYSQEPLASALKSKFGTARLGDLPVEALVTTSGIDRYSGHTFSTMRDPNTSLVDAALATSAAPTYFPAARPANSERSFMDGGLWANDPSLVAILHAQNRMGAAIEAVRLLSVGTGMQPNGTVDDAIRAMRTLSLKTGKFVFDFLMSAQASFSESYASTILPSESRIQLNPELTTEIALDDVKKALQYLPPLGEEYYSRRKDEILQRLADWKKLSPMVRNTAFRKSSRSRNEGHRTVYWCGPHNDATNYDMKEALESHGFEVRLPDDLASRLAPNLTSSERSTAIQRICRRAIDESDIVVVNLATYGLDSAWEMGYAEALGKNIVGYDKGDELLPVPRKVNKRFYRDNFMHGWEVAYTSADLGDLADRCEGKDVYLFCPYKNSKAIDAIKKSPVNSMASTLIISNERLGLDPDNPSAYTRKARSSAIQFLHQADVILAVLPRYGMDTAWKMGFAAALDKELIGWITDAFGGEYSESDYLDHWMHGWRKKPIVSTVGDLAAFIRGA